MFRFIAIRLAQAIPVLLVIYAITFFMIRLAPGSPFSDDRKVADHIVEQQKAYYGFDEPVYVQFFDTLWHFIRLDFPPLTSHPNIAASELIGTSLPISLELGFWALIVALALGMPAGILAAARKNSALDYAPMSLAMIGICLPTFVVGPLLALVFGIWLKWTNVAGWDTAGDKILPSLTLGLFYAAYIARLTRAGMLEILNADFIRTARAKGASETRLVLVHALRGGILPVISFMGPALAGLVTGSFVVETIFQIPGLGRHFVQAAINRDHALILTTVLLYASAIVIANIVVDVIQVLLNPKLRFE